MSVSSRTGGTFDIAQCTPFATDGSYTSASVGNYETLLNISKAGYLSSALVYANASTTALAKLRITLDGIVVFAGGCGALGSDFVGIGFMPNFHLIVGNTITNFRIPQSTVTAGATVTPTTTQRNHPWTDDTQKAFVYLSKELYFKQSLKIEIKSAAASAVLYSYQGGNYA